MEIGRFMRISQVCNWRIYDIDGDVDVVLLALFGRVHRSLWSVMLSCSFLSPVVLDKRLI